MTLKLSKKSLAISVSAIVVCLMVLIFSLPQARGSSTPTDSAALGDSTGDVEEEVAETSGCLAGSDFAAANAGISGNEPLKDDYLFHWYSEVTGESMWESLTQTAAEYALSGMTSWPCIDGRIAKCAKCDAPNCVDNCMHKKLEKEPKSKQEKLAYCCNICCGDSDITWTKEECKD